LLEAELFGPEPELPAAQAELKRLTARVRTASRWSEVRAVLEAVQLQGVTTQHIVNITAPHFGSPAAPQPPLRAGVTGTARSSSGDGSTPKIDAILISALFSHLPRLLRAGWGASGSAGGGHAAGGGVRMSESDRQEMAKAVDSLVRCHLVPMLKQPGALDAQVCVGGKAAQTSCCWGGTLIEDEHAASVSVSQGSCSGGRGMEGIGRGMPLWQQQQLLLSHEHGCTSWADVFVLSCSDTHRRPW
jgi:hypothetical protein